jgi:hypothetical protein
MPNFESPISNRKFQGQPMKTLDIPDDSIPTGGGPLAPSVSNRRGAHHTNSDLEDFQQRLDQEPDISAIEKEMKRAREEKISGQHRLNDGAKRRVDMLIGITRGTHSVTIEGNIYAFKTLKSREMREVMSACYEFDGSTQFPFEMRRQLLARSLTQIASVETSQFVGSDSLEDRLAFIDDADDILLNRLYDEYLKMVQETRDRYAIKTPEEAKEVLEDLKK